MNDLEKVEKLKEKANISYEEARAVLKECEWDLLEAVIKLENEGKISSNNENTFSTKGSPSSESPKSPQEVAESYQNYQHKNAENEKGFFHSLWTGIKYILKKSCENKFIVKKHGISVLDIPILLLIVLMIGFFWILLVLMIAGLFFGFSYNFAGPDLGREDVNNAMNKASKAAEDFKTEVKNNSEKNNEEKNTDN